MSSLTTNHRLLIDGQLRAATGGATFDNINPTTGQVAGTAPDATAADGEEALSAARRAFDETDWANDVALRVRVLRQLDDASGAGKAGGAMAYENGCGRDGIRIFRKLVGARCDGIEVGWG